MALPKIDRTKFPITIPSTGQKTTFIPFSVKEEKILLIAQESKDFEQIVTAVKQIIENCVQSVDVEAMPMFDLEFLLLNIRAQSVGDKIPFEIVDEETNETIELEFSLDKLEVVKNETHSKTIKLDERYSLIMKYPTIDQVVTISMNQDANRTTKLFEMMISCIDSLVDVETDSIFVFKEFSSDEVNEFIDSLSSTNLNKIKNFFETIPIIRYTANYKNKNGEDKTYVIEGLNSFFI